MSLLASTCNAALTQYGDQVSHCGAQLPMTGYAALVVLVLGILGITLGLILRSRTKSAEPTE